MHNGNIKLFVTNSKVNQSAILLKIPIALVASVRGETKLKKMTSCLTFDCKSNVLMRLQWNVREAGSSNLKKAILSFA